MIGEGSGSLYLFYFIKNRAGYIHSMIQYQFVLLYIGWRVRIIIDRCHPVVRTDEEVMFLDYFFINDQLGPEITGNIINTGGFGLTPFQPDSSCRIP